MIYSEYTSIHYLPHSPFHGSRIIADTELKTQSPSPGPYGLTALDHGMTAVDLVNAFRVKV